MQSVAAQAQNPANNPNKNMWLILGILHEAIKGFSNEGCLDDFWACVCQNSRWLVPARRVCVLLHAGENKCQIMSRGARGKLLPADNTLYLIGEDVIGLALQNKGVQWFINPWDDILQDNLREWLLIGTPEALLSVPLQTNHQFIGSILFAFRTLDNTDRETLSALVTGYALYVGMNYSLVQTMTQLTATNQTLETEIQERKRAELALQVQQEHLELLVEARTAELVHLNTQLQAEVGERVRAQEMLKAYSDQLEERVVARTKELSDALNNLQSTQRHLVEVEKMAALGNLVAGVAHEINTPVGIGVSMASLLEGETAKILKTISTGRIKLKDLKEYLQTAQESSTLILNNLQRAANLVQSFKQVAVDQTSHQQRLFQVKSYFEEILISLKPELKRVDYTIDVLGDEAFLLDSYPGDFAQIITNLIINSVLHGYNEGEKAHLTINFTHQDNQFKLVYTDDGCGISPENLVKIFDPFFTTSRKRGGTGLGLHIVYNIVTQKLKGTIQCTSEPGQGTQFIITLPLSLPST